MPMAYPTPPPTTSNPIHTIQSIFTLHLILLFRWTRNMLVNVLPYELGTGRTRENPTCSHLSLKRLSYPLTYTARNASPRPSVDHRKVPYDSSSVSRPRDLFLFRPGHQIRLKLGHSQNVEVPHLLRDEFPWSVQDDWGCLIWASHF